MRCFRFRESLLAAPVALAACGCAAPGLPSLPGLAPASNTISIEEDRLLAAARIYEKQGHGDKAQALYEAARAGSSAGHHEAGERLEILAAARQDRAKVAALPPDRPRLTPAPRPVVPEAARTARHPQVAHHDVAAADVPVFPKRRWGTAPPAFHTPRPADSAPPAVETWVAARTIPPAEPADPFAEAADPLAARAERPADDSDLPVVAPDPPQEFRRGAVTVVASTGGVPEDLEDPETFRSTWRAHVPTPEAMPASPSSLSTLSAEAFFPRPSSGPGPIPDHAAEADDALFAEADLPVDDPFLGRDELFPDDNVNVRHRASEESPSTTSGHVAPAAVLRDRAPEETAIGREQGHERPIVPAGAFHHEDTGDIGELLDGMRDPLPRQRSLAAYLLGENILGASPTAVVALQERMEVEDDPIVRLYVAEALLKVAPQSRDAAQVLIAALSDEDHRIRFFAACVVGDVPPRNLPQETLGMLSATLQDSQPAVRAMAALALGGFGPEARPAAAWLRDALDDPDPQVRQAAAAALACIAGD